MVFSAAVGTFPHTEAANPTAAPKGLDLAQATIDAVILDIADGLRRSHIGRRLRRRPKRQANGLTYARRVPGQQLAD